MFVDGEIGPKCDPLQEWWLLAQYYLAIPGTAANSERAFSAAGNMMNLVLPAVHAVTTLKNNIFLNNSSMNVWWRNSLSQGRE